MPITCDAPTQHYPSGCALLEHYDTDNDGKLTPSDVGRAFEDMVEGKLTEVELEFVNSLFAFPASDPRYGDINSKCPGCFGVGKVKLTINANIPAKIIENGVYIGNLGIINPAFEEEDGWQIITRSAGRVSLKDTSPHSGKYGAYVGESSRACSYAKMYQTICLPATATKLIFYVSWYKNTWGSLPRVEMDGNVIYRGDSSSGRRSIGWTRIEVDITKYAGKTVELAIVYQDEGTWCHMADHGAWIKVDGFVMAYSATLTLEQNTKYTFKLEAIGYNTLTFDYTTGTADATITKTLTPSTVTDTHTFNLIEGANYLSLPYLPADTNPENIFGPEVNVWGYDTVTDGWESVSNVKCIEGYYVYSPKVKSVTVVGADCVVTVDDLVAIYDALEPGQSALIGPGITDNKTPSSYKTIVKDTKEIKVMDVTNSVLDGCKSYNYVTKAFDPIMGLLEIGKAYLEVGNGYWIEKEALVTTITFVTKKQDGSELKGVSVYINNIKKGET